MSTNQKNGLPTNFDFGNIMQMAQQMAENIPKDSNGEVDFENVMTHLTQSMSSVMETNGMPMDQDTQNNINKITKNLLGGLGGLGGTDGGGLGGLAGMMMGGEQSIPPPIQNSKINIGNLKTDEVYMEKILKEPKYEPIYEEIDDNEDIDDLCPRTKDIEIDINVSLEELYMGKNKKLAIPRERIVKDGKKFKSIKEKKKINIPIEPGTKDGKVIRFNKEASEKPGYETGDIIVNIKEDGHPYFERDGDNLFVIKNISLYESFAVSLGIINLTIRHLDGSILILNGGCPPLHTKDGLRKIEGEGMPKYGKDERGDLYIRFNLILPEKIDLENLKKIKNLFPCIDEDIIYNDNTIGGLDVENRNYRTCNLEEVTEKDLEHLDYEEYSDESDSNNSHSHSEEYDSESYES